MSNPLQQTIEALAKEKGIEPDVVISAIEEAVATASRRYYKTGENLKTRFNMETGQVDLSLIDCILDCTPADLIDPYVESAARRKTAGESAAAVVELNPGLRPERARILDED